MSELYLKKEPSLFGYAEILAEFGETVEPSSGADKNYYEMKVFLHCFFLVQ